MKLCGKNELIVNALKGIILCDNEGKRNDTTDNEYEVEV